MLAVENVLHLAVRVVEAPEQQASHNRRLAAVCRETVQQANVAELLQTIAAPLGQGDVPCFRALSQAT